MVVFIINNSREVETNWWVIDMSLWRPASLEEQEVYNAITNAINAPVGNRWYSEMGYRTSGVLGQYAKNALLVPPCKIDIVVECFSEV